MISSLRGVVQAIMGTTVVCEVGGVGLAVHITPQHAQNLQVGETAKMCTTLIVREDSLTLYGFTSPDERQVFELLIGVSGVGPKSALGVLAEVTPHNIVAAVRAEDDRVFRKVTGIGPKTAKLIVLSLAGKLDALALTAGASASRSVRGGAEPSLAENVLSALVVLGWSERVATQVIDDVLIETPNIDTVQAALRLALARLGPAASIPTPNRE